MEFWDRVSFSMRRAWTRVSRRLGFRRRTGLGKLRQEVSACEYEDVQVMWDLLKRSRTRIGCRMSPSPPPRKRRRLGRSSWSRWAAPYRLCRAF